ncbi:homoserine O-succinyltransferase [Peribacillus cavernae]|uniref:Homoserine O-acetyltransferase n=1 Tax=Peribacillus cavernae TaxID=1674310 RepID=A0A433HL40_9BACI|nr:homoserine O-succinyltransferase [Peribacillus cavernae]MDQ0217993.1 homoserine O-succinyltransferase [Peribacillus cavernae]RUQ28959.1 homoserine O-succinyltransferase [Peribacillus cavernae]
MPIKIPRQLPAKEILESENIFVMDEERAISQDIRPLNIIILNLMPEKEKTEAQVLRFLGNTPLQVNISFMRLTSHVSKNTSRLHLDQFYKTFADVKSKKFDGMVITGAPVEKLAFEAVDYWDELKEIMDWTSENVTSTLHLCWGAQAALFHHYGIGKHELPQKCFGIFEHDVQLPNMKLVRGFDETFLAPHSRHTGVDIEELENHRELMVVSKSSQAGIFLISSRDGKKIMITGHPEYDVDTLSVEYHRDLQKGAKIDIPKNYFPDNDPKKNPVYRWKSHASLLFSNWLNYYVYQETPYEWD